MYCMHGGRGPDNAAGWHYMYSARKMIPATMTKDEHDQVRGPAAMGVEKSQERRA